MTIIPIQRDETTLEPATDAGSEANAPESGRRRRKTERPRKPTIRLAPNYSTRLVTHEAFTGQELPAVNIYENASAYFLIVEVPGVEPDDIDLRLAPESLEIKVRRQTFDPSGDGAFRRQECWSGWRQKFLEFPGRVNPEAAEAELSAGWLRLLIPREAPIPALKVAVHDRDRP